MSLIVTALQPRITRGLFDIKGPRLGSLPNILTRGSGYIGAYDSHRKQWSFDFRHSGPIVDALAGESSRLACAAFQSFADTWEQLNDANAAPWGLVKTYYSAFYAGHALLRIFGSGCTYLHGLRLQLVKQVLQAYGVADLPKKGLYKVSATQRDRVLVVTAVPCEGTHDGFWKVLYATMREATDSILTAGVLPTTDAQQVWGTLDSWIALCTQNGGHLAWPSELRNVLQYRQERDVWFPSALRAGDRRVLSGIAERWKSLPESINIQPNAGELGRFVSVCTFLVALCYAVIERIAGRCSFHGKSYLETGPLRYVRSLTG